MLRGRGPGHSVALKRPITFLNKIYPTSRTSFMGVHQVNPTGSRTWDLMLCAWGLVLCSGCLETPQLQHSTTASLCLGYSLSWLKEASSTLSSCPPCRPLCLRLAEQQCIQQVTPWTLSPNPIQVSNEAQCWTLSAVNWAETVLCKGETTPVWGLTFLFCPEPCKWCSQLCLNLPGSVVLEETCQVSSGERSLSSNMTLYLWLNLLLEGLSLWVLLVPSHWPPG